MKKVFGFQNPVIKDDHLRLVDCSGAIYDVYVDNSGDGDPILRLVKVKEEK